MNKNVPPVRDERARQKEGQKEINVPMRIVCAGVCACACVCVRERKRQKQKQTECVAKNKAEKANKKGEKFMGLCMKE